MTPARTLEPTLRKPLRLWPGVAIVTVQWLLWLVLPLVTPEGQLISFLGGVGGGLAVVVWWLFFSRAPWSERIGVLVLMVVAVIATRPFLDKSIQNGMMGMMFTFYVIPGLSLALVAGAAAGRRLSAGPRWAVMFVAILLACGAWTLLRTGGIYAGGAQLAWRWTPTPEQRLLAQAGDETGARPAAAGAVETRADWPGFRGPHRDSVVPGVRIETDWSSSPPVELWRRPIGPGWSSFAVRGNLLYTQEQRGEHEVVTCYDAATGEPVWTHRDAARFWESNAGAGPRGTPALSNGRVYSFGATGILNALDAGDGNLAWSRNVASDTGRKVPDWGFSSSPLVVDDVVIVAASGTLAAYDIATGKPRWTGPSRGGSYSSPHLVTIGGVPQVVLLSPPGTISVQPSDGTLLWEYTWEGGAIVQPALAENGDLLISGLASTGGVGLRRLAVTLGPGGWTTDERWTSRGLKPYFNDFVVHEGHAYGFDGSILAAIDLTDGQRKWKGGRYGEGQLVLLADQDLLLVLSEHGELALVKATPDQYTEVARFPAIEGKTWNHPVLVGDRLLVRNDQEMAAFRLTLAGG